LPLLDGSGDAGLRHGAQDSVSAEGLREVERELLDGPIPGGEDAPQQVWKRLVRACLINEPLLPQDVVISRLKACQQARAVLA
jgi:hypothetical protein